VRVTVVQAYYALATALFVSPAALHQYAGAEGMAAGSVNRRTSPQLVCTSPSKAFTSQYKSVGDLS
jgi:hypothetical protein